MGFLNFYGIRINTNSVFLTSKFLKFLKIPDKSYKFPINPLNILFSWSISIKTQKSCPRLAENSPTAITYRFA
jgi:hypothetical protein